VSRRRRNIQRSCSAFQAADAAFAKLEVHKVEQAKLAATRTNEAIKAANFRVPYVRIQGFRSLRVAGNFPKQSTPLRHRSVAQPG
jgi:hypothetical protein